MEFKVKIEAPEIVSAINNLADALRASRLSTPAFTDEIDGRKGFESSRTSEEKEPTEEVAEKIPTSAPSVPVASAPQYSIEQIMKAGATLMDEGKINELRELINSFGVEAVTNLKPDQLGAFATELRKLGAKI